MLLLAALVIAHHIFLMYVIVDHIKMPKKKNQKKKFVQLNDFWILYIEKENNIICQKKLNGDVFNH